MKSQADQIDFNVLGRVPSDARGAKAAQLELPVCSACGAVVPPGMQMTHRGWHAQVKSDTEAYEQARKAGYAKGRADWQGVAAGES